MKKIRFLETNISAFCDLAEDQQVVLPTEGVVGIAGINHDKGGSNASGKTSFSKAVIVNLFGPKAIGIASSELKNWHLKTPARIINKYLVNDEELVVDRTIGGKLQFKHGSEDWVVGGVEDVQSKLTELLQLSEDQVVSLTYKSQSQDETEPSFLLMTDSQRKDYLSSFFSLEHLDVAKEGFENELKAHKSREQVLNTEISTKTGSIESTKGHIAALSEQLVNTQIENNKQIKELEVKAQEAQATMKVWMDNQKLFKAEDFPEYQKYNANIAELEDLIANYKYEEKKTEMEAKLAEIESKIAIGGPVIPSELLDKQNKINMAISNANVMMAKKIKAQTQLTSLEAQLEAEVIPDALFCNHCSSPLSAEAHEEHKAKIEAKRAKIQSNIDAVRVEANSQVSYEAIEKLQAMLSDVTAQINEIKKSDSMPELMSLSKSLKDELIYMKKVIDGYNRQMSLQREEQANWVQRAIDFQNEKIKAHSQEFELLSLKIKDLQSGKNLVTIQRMIDTAEKSLQDTENSILEKQKELSELLETMELTEECIRILSRQGFPGYIFDSILQQFNFEINKNLKDIPVVSDYTLCFTPDKVSKSGKLSKEIVAEITKKGKVINWKSFSGGERLSFIIAVDEALDTVLSRRLGIKLGWKFMDEQFSFIDQNSKEGILEFLKRKATDKTYFLVDHSSEFNAAIEDWILVEKQNDIATVSRK